MKKFIVSLVAALMISPAALASPAYIQQIGANISAAPAELAVDLSAISGQLATMNATVSSLRAQHGGRADNLGLIEQRGTRNAASLVQEGAGNIGLIQQTGVRNSANLMQRGTDNLGLIQQSGRRNSADLFQSGHYNAAVIFQAGYRNSASVTQSGNNHRAFVSQQGRGNVAIISQR